MAKYILFGAGAYGVEALHYFGKRNVAFFCDNFYPRVKEIEGVQAISFLKLKKIYMKYVVVVCMGNYRSRLTVVTQLKEEGIPFEIFSPLEEEDFKKDMLHVHGFVDDIKYDWNKWEVGKNRSKPTIELFQKTFSVYKEMFSGKRIDFWIFLNDSIIMAYQQMMCLGLKKVFCYSTLDVFSDEIIAIPDYRFCFDEDNYYYEESISACKQAASSSYTDNRIYFRGTEYTSEARTWLKLLGKKYPEYIKAETYQDGRSKDELVSMLEYTKYKYLLDVRGFGWTDRTKILMQLGRPLFLVDRPYHEWYYEYLVPMKNYVPIKEDLSDLLEKYYYFEEHTEKYEEIVRQQKAFCEEYFAPRCILERTRDLILKHGVLQYC